ncbi:MAG: DUF790 family protein [Myxococcota bacterium]
MLTSDLLRTRIRDGRVVPEYLDVEDEGATERAERLVEIFREHRGGPKAPIDESVDRVVGHGTDYLIWRGLAKLLMDRSEFETVAAVDPVEIRRAVFDLAAREGPVTTDEDRVAIFEQVADDMELAADEVAEGLYADLDERQLLTDFEDIEPEALLERYNVALAQAVLYKAVRLQIELRGTDPNRLRYLFQLLKFNRLMHRATRIDSGYRIIVDGPASLFKSSRKYGIRMARFLPALLLMDDWSMTAALDWEDQEREFHLDSDQGLVSHYTAKGQWVAEEERYFEERFEEHDTDWRLERDARIVDLPDNQVLVTDYVLRADDGREVWIEVVGFWRLAYLERRIEMLSAVDVPLVLVVSERLKTGREQLEDAPPAVVFFKSVILTKKVLAAADAVSADAP